MPGRADSDDDDDLPPGWGDDPDEDADGGAEATDGVFRLSQAPVLHRVDAQAAGTASDSHVADADATFIPSQQQFVATSAHGLAPQGTILPSERQHPEVGKTRRQVPLLFTNVEAALGVGSSSGSSSKPPRLPGQPQKLTPWTLPKEPRSQSLRPARGARRQFGEEGSELAEPENEEAAVERQKRAAARRELEMLRARQKTGASIEDTLQELEALQRRVRSLGRAPSQGPAGEPGLQADGPCAEHTSARSRRKSRSAFGSVSRAGSAHRTTRSDSSCTLPHLLQERRACAASASSDCAPVATNGAVARARSGRAGVRRAASAPPATGEDTKLPPIV